MRGNKVSLLHKKCQWGILRVKKMLTEVLINAKMFCKKRCYREATVRLGYLLIKKAT